MGDFRKVDSLGSPEHEDSGGIEWLDDDDALGPPGLRKAIVGNEMAIMVGVVTLLLAVYTAHWEMIKFVALSVFLFEASRLLHYYVKTISIKYNLDVTLIVFVERAVRYLTTALVLYCIMRCLNIVSDETSPQIVGAFSIGIGLATQSTMSNFANGVMLVVFRPFAVGDVIQTQGEFATVKRVGLFFTHVNDFCNHRVLIPNSKMLEGNITNWSKNSSQVFKLHVNIRTGQCECSEIRKALQEAANAIDDTFDDVVAKEGLKVDQNRAKTIIAGPLSFSSEGMLWVLKVTGPSELFDPVTEHGMGHIHDCLFKAGIQIFEYNTKPAK